MILNEINAMPNSKDNLLEVSKYKKPTDSNFNCHDTLCVDLDEKKKNFLSILSCLETTQTDSLDSTEKMTEAFLVNSESSEKEISGETKNDAEILSILPKKTRQVHPEIFISQIQSNMLFEPLEQNFKEDIYNDLATIDSEDMIFKGQETETIEPGRNETQKTTEPFFKAVKQSVMTDINYSSEDTKKTQIIKEITEKTIGSLKQELTNESLPMDFDSVASDVSGKIHNAVMPQRRQEDQTNNKISAANLLQEEGTAAGYDYGRITTVSSVKADMMTDEGDFPKYQFVEQDSGNSVLNISTESKPGKTFQFNSVSNEIRSRDKSFHAEVLNQIVEKISPGLKARQSEIRIDLKPESLGHLRLHVSMGQNLVKVKILAENSLVKEMIENQVTLLKTELLQLGIKIDKVNVDLLMSGGSNFASTQHDGSGFKRASKEFETGIWQKESTMDPEVLESDLSMVNDRNNLAVNCFA